MGEQVMHVNGKRYLIDSTYTKIKSHYPLFDTLSFGVEKGSSNREILCQFKPDSMYTLIMACCASTDIVPSWKAYADSLKHWDYERDFEKIQHLLLDVPKFKVKLSNASIDDTIYAWSPDYACLPRIIHVKDTLQEYGRIDKCWYWTNISAIEFFKTDEQLNLLKEDDGFIYEVFPKDNRNQLADIFFRIFDNDFYTIVYDIKTKEIELIRN